MVGRDGIEPPTPGFSVASASPDAVLVNTDDISGLAQFALFGASEARWFLLGYLAGIGSR
jgi:hypothetical protein